MKKKIIIIILVIIGTVSLCNLLFLKLNKNGSIENKQIVKEEDKTSEIKDNDINKEESDNIKDETKSNDKDIQTENNSKTNNSIKEDLKDHSNNSNSNKNIADNASKNNSSNSSATGSNNNSQISNDKSNNNSIPEVIETTPVNQYIGVPDPNSFNYSFHQGVIEYNSMDSCLAAVPNISFKDTTDILNCWCMDVVDGQGTVLGQYLYIKCSSGNCNKYK